MCRRLVLLLTLGLIGCAGGPARTDSFYRLDPPAQQAVTGKHLGGTVLVAGLDSRGMVSSRNIVLWDPQRPNESLSYHYRLWVEPPAVLIQDALTTALRQAGIADEVITPAQHVRADYIVTGTVHRMEHRLAKQGASVLIDVELSLARTERRELVVLKRYREEDSLADDKINTAVEGFGKVLARVADRFIGDIVTAPR